MDVGKLTKNSYHKKCTMHSLNIEECFILKTSLINLQAENHFRDIFLWGKINGTRNNYYVCFGYELDALTDIVFRYSNNGVDWSVLPESKPAIQNFLKNYNNFLTGDPRYLLDASYKSKAKFSSDEHPEKVKEEDLLAATISLISEEALILPCGALLKQENGLTTINKHFKGLTTEESKDFNSYVHYRKPKYKWETNHCNQSDYSYEKYYFDPIDRQIPESCWNLQLEDGRKTVILQHLLWTGMTFIHNLGTNDYCSIYIGNGKKNIDAPFML